VASAPRADNDVWLDTSRREFELPADSLLRVSNYMGDVRARSSGDDKLLLVVVTQRFEADQNDAEVEASEMPGGLSITTHYPSAVAGKKNGRLAGRIDISLLIPAGRSLEIETRHGLIEVKGVDRDLVAETGSGNLRITSARSVSARTVDGEIRTALRHPAPEHPARFESRGGSIRIDFLDVPELPIRATTGGEIIQKLGERSGTRVEWLDGQGRLEVGSGPPTLEVISKTGRVELRAVGAHELR
jgi:hypothetical protein